MTGSARTYPLNAWYAVGWSREIGSDLLARTICAVPMVFSRGSDRAIAALRDACWHRALPLSLGRREGDAIVCGYHGLKFAFDGTLVAMPDGSPPPRACIPSYPVVERHALVWVWPGDPARADPAAVPDLHWAEDPDWVTEGNALELACDYRLVVDNLMDLTHETWVHASSIGDDAVARAPFAVRNDGRYVELDRWMIDIEAPPFLARQFALVHGLGASTRVDRWQLSRFEAPATVVIDVGVAETGSGAPAGDRSRGISARVLNTVTPVGDGESRYFFAYARDFLRADAALTQELKLAQTRIFLEDKTILEAQQRALAADPNRRLVDLPIDRGSHFARRRIAAMIRAEEVG